jgi:prepilin-type N-terminal cleavage/methylation domain-containing protein
MHPARRSVGSKHKGFSLVEMMMTLAIGLVLASVALPMIVGAVQNYRLNSVAQQTANLIDMTRYTAVRRNTVVSFRTTTQGPNTVFYVDLKGNSVLDAMDPLVVIPTDMQIANGQPLTPAANSTGLSQTQDFSTQITFDYRGTVYFQGGGAMSAYFLALGYTNQAQYGTRAVTVTPMGQTKTWTAPAGGTWSGM